MPVLVYRRAKHPKGGSPTFVMNGCLEQVYKLRGLPNLKQYHFSPQVKEVAKFPLILLELSI
jgi:hypothetical protein